jgi:cation:H+ antiporter
VQESRTDRTALGGDAFEVECGEVLDEHEPFELLAELCVERLRVDVERWLRFAGKAHPADDDTAVVDHRLQTLPQRTRKRGAIAYGRDVELEVDVANPVDIDVFGAHATVLDGDESGRVPPVLREVVRFERAGIRVARTGRVTVEVADHGVRGTCALDLGSRERRHRFLAGRHPIAVRSVEEEQVRARPVHREVGERRIAIDGALVSEPPERDAVRQRRRREAAPAEDDDVVRKRRHLTVDRRLRMRIVIAGTDEDAHRRELAEHAVEIRRAIGPRAAVFVQIARDGDGIDTSLARERQRALERVAKLLAPAFAEPRLEPGERHVEMHVGDVQDAIRHRQISAPEERIASGLNGGPVLTALQVLGALLLMVVCSDAFTNAVEWIGALFGLTRSAIGAVVAAVGSSLPETMVAIVALLVLRDPVSQAIGIGAVLGAPFMLGTLAFAMVGAMALLRPRQARSTVGALAVQRDVAIFGLALFVLTFAFVVGASFAPTMPVRAAASALVLIAYSGYLAFHLRRSDPESDEAPPPLRFAPNAAHPSTGIVFAQLAVALVLSVVASRWFVSSIGAVSSQLGLSALVVSLILSPIATEIPEMLNVSIWMRRGQDELALGNVVGAMIFQTSIASAIAMLASPWVLDRQAYAACVGGFSGALLVLVSTLIRRRVEPVALVACAVFYLAAVIYVALVR